MPNHGEEEDYGQYHDQQEDVEVVPQHPDSFLSENFFQHFQMEKGQQHKKPSSWHYPRLLGRGLRIIDLRFWT